MTDLIIPDISEFQGKVDWKTLISNAYPAAIIRAHNGSRADYQWLANRAGAHANGIQALGIYQYLQASHDAAVQANALADLIGTLKPGEWAICDLEEGTGDQSGRAHTWYTTIANRLHNANSEELYSGDYFFGAHRLSAAGFKRIWVAAYNTSEPSSPLHELWQFTDARHFPGIAGSNDASVFHGTIAQLLNNITPAVPTPPEDDFMALFKSVAEFEASVTKAGIAALQSQPGRDAEANANMWWWDHVLNGTTTPGMTPAQVSLIMSMHASLVKLAATPAPTVAGK